METSNTWGCAAQFRGQKVVGVLQNLSRAQGDHITGTMTLLFEDGRGLSLNGSFWEETKENIDRALTLSEKTVQEMHGMLIDIQKERKSE